jgi:eukaryotic-like serine/threonine-protein kinase
VIRQLAHYRILGVLGRGGMGEVYLAEDERLKRRVALKILPAGMEADSESVRRFFEEARVISALNHPAIITIYEIGSDQGRDYMATEHVDGWTLRERIEDRPAKVSEAIEVAIQVAGALGAAHAAGVIHRDVKPENIMIRRDGYVKLLDFGVARLIDREESATGVGARFGTAHYTAPEIYAGEEGDARSDFFSLGAVLYEMLAGRPPFDGETGEEVKRAILDDRLTPLSQLNREVPNDLRRIIGRCLASDPGERPQTAGHLLAELNQLRREYEIGTLKRRVTDPIGRPDEPLVGNDPRYRSPDEGPRPLLALIASIAIALMVIAATGWVSARRQARAARDSIAVLPFVNATGNPRHQYMADGLTETLIQQLSYVPGLKVMARGSVYRFQGAPYDPRRAGRELSVDTVLTGRVEDREGEVVVTAELFDVLEGTRLWAGSYRGAAEKLSEVELLLARGVASELRSELRGVTRRNASDAAHRLYLQGRYHWNRRQPGDLEKADDLFRKALDEDPLYAMAWAGLADTWNLIGSYGDRPPVDSFPRARAAARRALELEPGLAEAHTSYAYALQNYDWDWEGADRAYRRAIELRPSYATAHHWYGGFLMIQGRFEEALDHRKMAVAHDPLSPQIQASLGSPYLLAREYEKAIALFRHSLEMDPNYAQGHFALGWALFHSGATEEGIHHLEMRAEIAGQSADSLADLAYVYARSGRTEEALEIRERLEQVKRSRYISPYKFARISIGLGDHDEAFRLIEEAYLQRSNYLTGIVTDPTLDPLRDDPRFRDLLRRMNLEEIARAVESHRRS